jgi:hypothetical protein
MKIIAARYISIAGHPLVLLPLLIFLARNQGDGSGALRTTLVFVAITSIPLGFLIWRSRATGRWRTVDASDKVDRPVLYRGIIAVLVALAIYFQFVDRAPDIVRGCIATAGMMCVAAALNRRLKISLHLAFACFCGIILMRIRLAYGVPVLLLVPALIWSRLVLSRHALSETFAGVALGVIGASCVIWL